MPPPMDIISYLAYAGALLVLWVSAKLIYNVYFHPLRAVPGPFSAKLSRWWLFRLEMRGNPHPNIMELHRQYGKSASAVFRGGRDGRRTWDVRG
jgi:hypothetical protein